MPALLFSSPNLFHTCVSDLKSSAASIWTLKSCFWQAGATLSLMSLRGARDRGRKTGRGQDAAGELTRYCKCLTKTLSVDYFHTLIHT